VTSVEEIDVLKEEVMSSPVLLRVWAEFVDNDYIGAAHPGPRFEGIYISIYSVKWQFNASDSLHYA